MKFYQEITLLPDVEISTYFLWTKVFTQVHLALADIKNQQGVDGVGIGIAFPNYKPYNDTYKGTLGNKLRVFASDENELTALNLNVWLERLTDYVHISRIRPVPSAIKGHACYYRAFAKMTADERVIHQAKRRNISIDESKAHFKDYADDAITYPFIRLKSLSSDKDFLLHIAKQTVDKPATGKFGTYGLSRTVSVPEF